MGESGDDFVGGVLNGFGERVGEFVGEGLDAKDENGGGDGAFEVFNEEGERELVGRESDAADGIFVDEFDGAGIGLHEGSVDKENEVGVGVDEVADVVFGDGAGVDEFDVGWIAVLELVNDVGADAVVGFEVVTDAENGYLRCISEGFGETFLPGCHQVRKTGRML